ncbi:Long-chain-fatty-acid--CoA ligase [invertebrate metagenome]|uniref:Long-chain-fatty-acid--CoA ligase n=1 Tax=invertebrate metagenome TaxID=1711999 RepID=A0A484H5M9_9ZZZZ
MISPVPSLDRYDQWPSLVTMFFEQAERVGRRPLLWAKRDGIFCSMTGQQAAASAAALARGLHRLGVRKEDRVMLVSENRPEWLLSDIAIMAAGGITVPAYTTNTVADHRHILNDAAPVVAIVSTSSLAAQLLPALSEMRHPPRVIFMEPDGLPSPHAQGVSWAEVVTDGSDRSDALATIERDDTACIIYTSGTGGTPKGVMLSHRAILFNCMGAFDILNTLGLKNEIFLSFLPLSHAYEHTAGQFFPISIGAQIYYAEGIDHLAANLREARPTLMTAVPRLYEILRARILQAVKRQGGLRIRLFRRALALGYKRYEKASGLSPDGLSPVQYIADRLLDPLVRHWVTAFFGGRLKAMISGGAPLNPEIGLFFTALGVRLLQGYGQTEAAPVISCNRPDDVRLDTVGPPLRRVTVRIAEDGEILVQGPLVMQGYWKQPEASREIIDSAGWLHTGDVGEVDDAGRIRITDRKRDIIISSGGDNISPQRVENSLALEPAINQAIVYGDGRPHLVALIVPDNDFLDTWRRTHGTTLEDIARDPAFRKAMSAVVERVNKSLSQGERIKRFTIITNPFSVANGLLTPTLKVRRYMVQQIYGARLDSLYD